MTDSPAVAKPTISVIIPTRDRGAEVVRAVSSVLASDYPHLELIVVDQSSDDITESALGPILEDPRCQLVRTTSTGISAARNLGFPATSGEIIGLTDDDCEASSEWVSSIVDSFAYDPAVGSVVGNVVAAPHDPTAGFIPAYCRDEPLLVAKANQSHRIGGMGACMAVRRGLWQQLEGFDERLGVGTEIGAGEDTDFLIRTLLAGHSVFLDPDVEIEHHGFRPWDSRRSLIHRYWQGTGAAFALNTRTAPLPMAGSLLSMSGRWLVGGSPIADSFGDRSHRLSRLSSFLQGFLAGLTLPPRPDHKPGT